MRICVDARTVSVARRGIGKTLVSLYRHIGQARPDWQLLLFHQVPGPDQPFADLANVQCRCIDIPGDRWNVWQRVRLPLAARFAGASVLHCPANTSPAHPLAPMVLTVHDLIPLDMPGEHPNPQAWVANVSRATHLARVIMTPSDYSKRRMVEALGVAEAKIVVNAWAADPACRPVTDRGELSRVRTKVGLDGDAPYVFAFGAADSRKNTARIIQAWATIAPKYRQTHRLVLVGIQESARSGFADQARQAGCADSVILHGYLADADIVPLLSGAHVMCYPSLSEGFGLPVLDAFACGTAVLTSNTTSLPEVAGDAAVLVDPADARAIARGLEELLGDDRGRSELAARGTQRASQFTWPACAARACRVFAEAVAND